MTHIRDIAEHFLGDKAEEFAEWAFGPDFKSLRGPMAYLEKWHELHGSDLLIDPKGKPSDDVPKMIEVWKKKLSKGALEELTKQAQELDMGY